MSKSLKVPDRQDAFAPVQSRPQPRQRILVVEDDTIVSQLYSEVLIRHGYLVDTAEDGEAGWHALRAVSYAPDSYDLLITDNNMPKMSGVELIRKVRAAHMALPVVMASALLPPGLEEFQLAAILSKPFYPEELAQTVRTVLQVADNFPNANYHSLHRFDEFLQNYHLHLK